MARVSIIFGLLLCGLSALGMVGTTQKMPALFIPMMYGIPVLFCGVVALNPHRRRIAVAFAACIMLVAAVGSFARCGYGIALASKDPELQHPEIDRYAAKLAIATTAVSVVFILVYLVTWLQSRRQARLMDPDGTPANLSPPTSRKNVASLGSQSLGIEGLGNENDHSGVVGVSDALATPTTEPCDVATACEPSSVREFTASPDP